MEADRAAKRAMEAKTSGRKRRRGGNYSIYWLMALAAFVVVFIILANTVLFNCASIQTEGSVRYTSEQIADGSGIKIGDNLLRINTKTAEQKVLKAFDYIDTVEVTKIYPTTIKISVKEAEKWFLLCENGTFTAVSRNGKLIDLGEDKSLVHVYGFEPIELAPGGWLASAVEGKNDIPAAILEAADKTGFNRITEIDLTDRFSITAKCGENITLELGNITGIESKLSIAKKLIETEVADGAQVIIRLSDPDKVAIKPVVDESHISLEHTEESATEESSTNEQ
ncbi:MAG: cell division protein FtsQ/DivIB [Oscillospiraceae bacterium]